VTFCKNNFEKVSLILIISLMLSLNICIYDHLLDLEAKFKDKFFLENLDLARMLLLDLKEMSKEILEILACLLFHIELKRYILLKVLLFLLL